MNDGCSAQSSELSTWGKKKSTFPLGHMSNPTCIPVPVWALLLWPIKNNFKFTSLFLLKILVIFPPWNFIPVSVWFWSARVLECDFKFSQVSEKVVCKNSCWIFFSSTVCTDVLQIFIKIRKPSYFIFTCLFFDSSRLFSVFLGAAPPVNTWVYVLCILKSWAVYLILWMFL